MFLRANHRRRLVACLPSPQRNQSVPGSPMRPKRHRPWLSVAVCAWLSACAADTSNDGSIQQGLDPDEQASVLEFLQSNGFDTSEARFDGGDFVLTGDVRVDAFALLNAAQATVEKGFWIKEPNSVPAVAVPTPHFPAYIWTFNLSLDWTFAFFFAALEWNAKTPVEFFWGTPPAGEENYVTVAYWPFEVFPLPEIPEALELRRIPAWAWPPAGGNVGDTVLLNSNYSLPEAECGAENIDALSWDQKLWTATHELGHVLGFDHPTQGIHIEGTERVGKIPYPSVMWPTQGGISCPSASPNDKWTTTLSEDDILSAEIMFEP